MHRIAFIVHGKTRRQRKLLAELKATFSICDLHIAISERPHESMNLSLKAAREGATHIICVGGDGSVNEVVNGLMMYRRSTNVPENWDAIRLGLLPFGTGNDFAKTMHITADVRALKDMIEADSQRALDLGRASFVDPEGNIATRYFINIADVGIGGVIAHRMTSASRVLGASLTYQKVIIGTLIKYKKQEIQANTDSFKFGGKITNFIIANGKYFGSGMGIAPDAEPDDGSFQIVVAGDISTWDYLRNLGTVRRCKRVSHPHVHYHSAREISVQSSGEPLPIDMDGEFVGYSPLNITLVPHAIKFLCSRSQSGASR